MQNQNVGERGLRTSTLTVIASFWFSTAMFSRAWELNAFRKPGAEASGSGLLELRLEVGLRGRQSVLVGSPGCLQTTMPQAFISREPRPKHASRINPRLTTRPLPTVRTLPPRITRANATPTTITKVVSTRRYPAPVKLARPCVPRGTLSCGSPPLGAEAQRTSPPSIAYAHARPSSLQECRGRPNEANRPDWPDRKRRSKAQQSSPRPSNTCNIRRQAVRGRWPEAGDFANTPQIFRLGVKGFAGRSVSLVGVIFRGPRVRISRPLEISAEFSEERAIGRAFLSWTFRDSRIFDYWASSVRAKLVSQDSVRLNEFHLS